MTVKRGKTRIVIVLGKIAIKLPRLYLLPLLRSFIWHINKSRKTLKLFLKRELPRYLLRGIICNWIEFTFYENSRLHILAATYFSLFGLINIQSAEGVPLEMEDVDLWVQLFGLTNEAVWGDSHAFAESDNFIVANGKIQMVDYGSRNTQKVLLKWGNKMQDNFNLSFKRNYSK